MTNQNKGGGVNFVQTEYTCDYCGDKHFGNCPKIKTTMTATEAIGSLSIDMQPSERLTPAKASPSHQNNEDEVKHILGHCYCRDNQPCWFEDTYERLHKEERDPDVAMSRLSDEQDQAIQQLIADEVRNARIEELERYRKPIDKIESIAIHTNSDILDRIQELKKKEV